MRKNIYLVRKVSKQDVEKLEDLPTIYFLDLENSENLFSDLEEITRIHTFFSGGLLYESPPLRGMYNQFPQDVDKFIFNVNSREDIDVRKIKKIILEKPEPCVIYYKNLKTNELIEKYFLPKAADEVNLFMRVLE
jgi:hypothetical protein